MAGGLGFGHETLNDSAIDPAVRVFEANLRAALEETATADASPTSSDFYARAPIGVDTSSTSSGGTLILSAGSSTWSSDSNGGTVFVPPAPDWSAVPVAAPLNANTYAGSYPGATFTVAPPVNPAFAPNWNGFAPVPRTGNWNSGIVHPQFSTFPSSATPAALSSAPTVFSPAAAVTSMASTGASFASTGASLAPTGVSFTRFTSTAAIQTLTAPASGGVGGATLTTNALVASPPSTPASSGSVQPQSITPATFIYVADSGTTPGTVQEYSATAGGAPITSGFTTISTPAPTSLAAVLNNNPTLPGIWVGDNFTLTVKAYNNAGAQISSSVFATITGVFPNALAVSSNGQDLFVADGTGDTVKEYNAMTGAVISSFSVSTPNPASLTISTNGQDIYIGDGSTQTVKEYAISNGQQVGGFSISNVYPGGLGMSANGQQIFVADEITNTVEEYNAGNGNPVAFSLSPAPGQPDNILAVGSQLYVADQGPDTTEFYNDNTSVGTAVNGFTNIAGNNPNAVAFIPEPSTGLLLLGAGAMFLGRRRRGKKVES